MKTIAIIPARGGSKRVARKNILPLNGIPLLAYSIRAAKESGVFTDIIVSSDDNEILDLALKEGVGIDRRPEALAIDTATKVQVVKEFIGRPENRQIYDAVCALLPTCPFRLASDIQKAFEVFEQGESPFLISVTAYDFPIQQALKEEDGLLMVPFFENGYKVTRSQDIAKTWHPNGAIYLATVEAFLNNGTFFADRMLTYEMPAIRSFDIDYPWQFEIAEVIAQKKLYL